MILQETRFLFSSDQDNAIARLPPVITTNSRDRACRAKQIQRNSPEAVGDRSPQDSRTKPGCLTQFSRTETGLLNPIARVSLSDFARNPVSLAPNYKEAAKNRKQTRDSPDPAANPLYNLMKVHVVAEHLPKVSSST